MTQRKKIRRTKRRLWSVPRITHPEYPGYRVRVTELSPGGNLYLIRMLDGKQRMLSLRCTRTDLGATAKAQERAARTKACKLIARLATEGGKGSTDTARADASEALTLDALTDIYEQRGFFGRTEQYQRDQVSAIRRIATYLGPHREVARLKPSDTDDYKAHRQAKGVRVAARSDLIALRIACNWARREGLLDDNPLAPDKVKLPRIHKPRRPVVDEERYDALKTVADQLPPAFGVLLDLAWHTGRRISAILSLRWEDVSFEPSKGCPNGKIRWYAGRVHTNKAHEQVKPMHPLAREALVRWRDQCPGIGNAYLFPAPKNPAKPLGRYIPKRWLRKAEDLAELEHMEHGGWHAFRRGWTTARKDFPLVDLAEAGGWYDTASVVKCYTHADPETTLAVIAYGS